MRDNFCLGFHSETAFYCSYFSFPIEMTGGPPAEDMKKKISPAQKDGRKPSRSEYLWLSASCLQPIQSSHQGFTQHNDAV